MKRIWFLCILFFISVLLCGCGKHILLTDHEMDIMAEYVADLLLRNDERYEPTLLSKEDLDAALLLRITPTPSPTPSPSPTPTPTAIPIASVSGIPNPSGTISPVPTEQLTDSTVISKDLSRVIGNDIFSVTYKGYKLEDVYISNANFSLEDVPGKKYLIVTFDIQNQSASSKTFRPSTEKITYALDVNLGSVTKPCLTLVENDMQYMVREIARGETIEGVLVFEVVDDVALTSLNLSAMKQSDTVIIKLK